MVADVRRMALRILSASALSTFQGGGCCCCWWDEEKEGFCCSESEAEFEEELLSWEVEWL